MAFRVRASKLALAAAFAIGASSALFVANVRERAYDGPWIGWLSANPAPPRSRFFGWPFIAVSQKDRGDGGVVFLEDGDFCGEEAETTSPPWITLPPLINPWIDLHQALAIHCPLYFAANAGLAAVVVLGTVIMAEHWRRGRAAVSLLGIFLWVAFLGVFLGSARLSKAEEFEAFWAPRQVYQIDWLDTVCFAFIAAGCTCALFAAARLLGRVRSAIKRKAHPVTDQAVVGTGPLS